jgi:hypothetical protein
MLACNYNRALVIFVACFFVERAFIWSFERLYGRISLPLPKGNVSCAKRSDLTYVFRLVGVAPSENCFFSSEYFH